MYRLGFFTGKLYDSSVDQADIKECSQVLNFNPPVSENEPCVQRLREKLHRNCYRCLSCESAQTALDEADKILEGLKEKENEKQV